MSRVSPHGGVSVLMKKKKNPRGLLSSLQQAESHLQAKKVPFPK